MDFRTEISLEELARRANGGGAHEARADLKVGAGLPPLRRHELDAEGWRDKIAGNCRKLMNIWEAGIPIIAGST